MTREEMLDLAVSLVDEINELKEMVQWLNCRLEDEIKPPFDRVKETMIYLIKVGRFIAAVKEYRTYHKSSLLEAKNYADRLREEIFEGKHGLFDNAMFIRNYGINFPRARG